VVKVPNSVDTDTISGGGHGTHVNGIVAGRPTTLTDGTQLQGAAPGASLVDISTGAVLLIVGADSALNWVLENHDHPCGASVPASTCPPIKVTNNSYGPTGGGAFDPNSATVKLQDALAAAGVVTVWAAGNDGGDGSSSLTNPPGQDPTGGIISVASYFDQDTGTRDGVVSDYSSRGAASDPSTWPDLSAPGENITSSCRLYLPICSTGLAPQNGPGPLDIGTFNTISGTSMAAPHIAGIVAQLFQADPTATPAEIEAALKGSAYRYTNGAAYQTVGGYSTSFDKGTGLVDVVAAVARLTA
jgi:serine protease AprX